MLSSRLGRSAQQHCSCSGRPPPASHHRHAPHRLAPRCRSSVQAAEAASVAPPPPPISLSDKALLQLKKLRSEVPNAGSNLLLRVGVKQGGCSGMSYVMDFEDSQKVTADDMVLEYDSGSFSLVVDPKSLLYVFGMKLDYSDALIGGGFQFHNPNAQDSCGCGKSFGV